MGALVLLSACLSAGCMSALRSAAVGAVFGREWRYVRCYEGPQVPLADVSVLLAPEASDLALFVSSVDGAPARAATEYHLLPGRHTIVVLPRPSNYQRGDPATIVCTMRAGAVYILVPYSSAQHIGYSPDGFSWEGAYSPEVAELGDWHAVGSIFAIRDTKFLGWKKKPPKHWTSADQIKTPRSGRRTDDLHKLTRLVAPDGWSQWAVELQMPDVEERRGRAAHAAWLIVADDATYEQLRVLFRLDIAMSLSSILQLTGTKVIASDFGSIDETDAAMGMRLAAQAGIDVTRKVIWRDRARIAQGVSHPALRSWLEHR
jgi:hypothetical protein